MLVKPLAFRLPGGDFRSINLAGLDGVEPAEPVAALLHHADGHHWRSPPARMRHL